MAPVLSPDGKTLFVCNRFDNDISLIDLETGKEQCRIPVQREPVAAAISRDGRFLLVANLLHTGPADAELVAAVVSVIDTAARKVALVPEPAATNTAPLILRQSLYVIPVTL